MLTVSFHPTLIPETKIQNSSIHLKHVEASNALYTAQDKNFVIVFKINNMEYMSENEIHIFCALCTA